MIDSFVGGACILIDSCIMKVSFCFGSLSELPKPEEQIAEIVTNVSLGLSLIVNTFRYNYSKKNNDESCWWCKKELLSLTFSLHSNQI